MESRKPEASKHLLKYSIELRGKPRNPDTTRKIKQNKLLNMCKIMYNHYPEITDINITHAISSGLLTRTYPKNVAKIINGLGYLPSPAQILSQKDHN